MKLVTFEAKTPVGLLERMGALDGDRVIDLHAAYPGIPEDMLAFLDGGEKTRCS